MTNAELADEIEQRMKDSSPVEDFAVFLAGNAAAIIAALRRQPSSDQVLVPRDIHPLDNPNGDKIIRLLMNPPSAGKFDDPNAYYDHWWSLLLAAAEAEGRTR